MIKILEPDGEEWEKREREPSKSISKDKIEDITSFLNGIDAKALLKRVHEIIEKNNAISMFLKSSFIYIVILGTKGIE